MNNKLFEGPEKKLEIILFSPQQGIRSNENGRWKRVVKASSAEIISTISNDKMDAYLLSESSLFVWEDRILMITCGRTMLVRALPEIIRIVGKDNIAFVFYEQKNFLFPNDQPSTFEADMAEVTRYFPGKYYKIGPANDDHINVFYSSHAGEMPEEDATLQILMHDSDPDAMKIFCKGESDDSRNTEMNSGLDRLYAIHTALDSYLFTPAGYSLNGIAGECYYTVHVTPQPQNSYVSFETNIFETDYSGTIQKVVDIFRPGRFSLVLTSSMDSRCWSARKTVQDAVPDYTVADKSIHEFDCGYGVAFLNYRKSVKNNQGGKKQSIPVLKK